MVTTMSNSDRWATAVHESAHGVVAIALGGRCDQLCILHGGGGVAFIDQLSPFDFAIAVAAPTAAAELLADVPPPEHAPTPANFDERESFADLTPREKIEYIAAKFPENESPSDAHTIAQYCIRGLEDEPPDRWVSRYCTVHRAARDVVTDHRDQILAVATALFRDGILTKTQIEELLK